MTPASKGPRPHEGERLRPASRAPDPPATKVPADDQSSVPSKKKASRPKKTATGPRTHPPRRRRPRRVAKKAAPVVKKTAPSPRRRPTDKAAPAAKGGAATKRPPAKATAPAKKAVATKVGQEGAAKEPPRRPRRPRPRRQRHRRRREQCRRRLGDQHALHPQAEARGARSAQDGTLRQGHQVPRRAHDLLLTDRAIYQEQATSLRAEADSLALEREPGDVQFDEESGEGGTVTVDRERNLALSGQATLAVEEIDYALERLADKTYGYCERCFQPIPKPRLRALPYARLCVACKSGGLSRR